MDPKDLETLELPKVLERLADYAAFSASKDLVLQLRPTTKLEVARLGQQLTTEARRLRLGRPDVSIGGARDVRPRVQAAARGAVLEPQELLDIQATLISSRNLARVFGKEGSSYPALAGIAVNLAQDTGLIEAISRTLDGRGNVLDGASEKLRTIRRDLRAARERLGKKLSRLVGDPKLAALLQEPIVTQRDGRSVIPLRAEYKGRFPAVVHDQSASGATLFVEPLEVVEHNNAVRELELKERDEVRRVLAELSATIGLTGEAIDQSVEALAQLDLAFAKARFADALDASEPVLNEFGDGRPRLRLLAARHPLLVPSSVEGLDPATVVPIDLVLEPEVRAIVITGPNTGGKTVSLKTAGLLASMAQCGLHIPAAVGSELEVFEAIYADIGDEQSIEQSLSTFSSHISNIVRILGLADARCLVMLDELGAGTDPGEGAALARALLVEFLDRGCVTLVATHYPELKAFAHLTEGVRNASVEFDLESLRPTYHLTIGLPGRSNALAIAERLGLRQRIVEAARSQLSPDDLQADSLLDEIRRQRDAGEQARSEAERASKEAKTLRDELRRRLDGIDAEKSEILDRARQEAQAKMQAVDEELAGLRRRLVAAGESLEPLRGVKEELEQLEAVLEASVTERASVALDSEDLVVGDPVRVRSIAAEGVVTALEADQAEVQVGRLRIRADLDDLELLAAEAADTLPERQVEIRAVAASPSLVLHLRGQTVDEALEQLERSLDSAYLAGMPFLRVIHGKGTGRLRQAVRESLRKSPYVDSFETAAPAEGGEGVTVARLKQD
ncbi:MAG: endonuclease MutS2 [Chloroflexota bacterium]